MAEKRKLLTSEQFKTRINLNMASMQKIGKPSLLNIGAFVSHASEIFLTCASQIADLTAELEKINQKEEKEDGKTLPSNN